MFYCTCVVLRDSKTCLPDDARLIIRHTPFVIITNGVINIYTLCLLY